MIGGLVRKELRDQRPYFALFAALFAVSIIEILASQIDLLPLGRQFYEFGTGFSVFQFLISFAVGNGLLVREIDTNTLGFLDGLPLTRTRAFVAKAVVGMLVLLAYPLAYLSLCVGLHLFARESLDHALQLHLLVVLFIAIALLSAVGLACGMLFGFLRNLGLMLLALCAIALNLLTSALPRMSMLNPLDLLNIRLVGAHWNLPFSNIVAQLSVAAAFTLLALWIFNSAGAGRGRGIQVQLNRPVVSATVTVFTMIACIGAFALYMEGETNKVKPPTDKSINGAVFAQTASGHAKTQHYTFSYPAQRAEQVELLVKNADAIFDYVGRILDIDGGKSIDVDLSGSMDNTAGTAYFERIRMAAKDKESLTVLAHETTHVLARRLAGGANERELSKMRAFNEGLAHWVEKQYATNSGLTDLDRLQAAIVAKRHSIDVVQLTDMNSLEREADSNLQYPLGAVLIDTTVRRYGPHAPKQILLTLGRSDFPRDLKGVELWHAAYQLSGYDLALVFDDYAQRVNEWTVEFVNDIAALPRPRGSLVRSTDGEDIGVELKFDRELPSSWRAVVRFRPSDNSGLEDYLVRRANDDIAWQSIDRVSNEEVCFQPGVLSKGTTIYEAWQCLPISSAVEFEAEEEEYAE